MSHIPWDVAQVPHLPNTVIATKELIVRTDYQLTKSQWREEQKADASISTVLDLFHLGQLSAYNCKKSDLDDLKGLLWLRKDLFLDSGLLYRKAYFRITDIQVNQFVIPTQFHKCTVTICH